MAGLQRNGSLKITEHPGDPIEIACQKCGRSGRYQKAMLIEKYGSGPRLALRGPWSCALTAVHSATFPVFHRGGLARQLCPGQLAPKRLYLQASNSFWRLTKFNMLNAPCMGLNVKS